MLNDIISKYKSAFTHNTELRAQVNSEYRLTLDDKDGTIEQITQTGGVSARIFENGVYGFAASGTYNEDSVRWVLDTAARNARAISRYGRRAGKELPDISCGNIPLNYTVQTLDPILLREAAEELKRYAESKYAPATAAVDFWNSTSEKLLVVKNGFDGRSNVVLGSISVYLRKTGPSGDLVTGEETLAINEYLIDILESKMLYQMVDRAYENLRKKLSEEKKEKVTVENGVWDCILSPEFTGMLAHEAVGHTCEADAVVSEGSIAAAYMGKEVASSLVSLTDFAYEAYGERCPISLHIDDEGVACRDAPIIRNGILVGCMTNRLLAERLGVENTGNARASDYYDEPIVRMRNTCFLPGNSKLDDMIASIKRGYYLVKSGGGNGSLKGEFSMTMEQGYEIVDGKLGRPLRGTQCSGVAWEALKTVDMVSSNFVDSKACGICGKKQGIPTSQGGPEMKMKLHLIG